MAAGGKTKLKARAWLIHSPIRPPPFAEYVFSGFSAEGLGSVRTVAPAPRGGRPYPSDSLDSIPTYVGTTGGSGAPELHAKHVLGEGWGTRPRRKIVTASARQPVRHRFEYSKRRGESQELGRRRAWWGCMRV